MRLFHSMGGGGGVGCNSEKGAYSRNTVSLIASTWISLLIIWLPDRQSYFVASTHSVPI